MLLHRARALRRIRTLSNLTAYPKTSTMDLLFPSITVATSKTKVRHSRRSTLSQRQALQRPPPASNQNSIPNRTYTLIHRVHAIHLSRQISSKLAITHPQ